jgi:hypothetical protein
LWLRRGSLDRRLAAGAHPAESPDLALRARQPASARFRARLADSIRGMIEDAKQPPRADGSAVPIRWREILKEGELLSEVAADLDSDDALQPRGIALVERLLTDGALRCTTRAASARTSAARTPRCT